MGPRTHAHVLGTNTYHAAGPCWCMARWWIPGLGGLVALALLAGTPAVAQGDRDPPPVEIEPAVVDGPVEPVVERRNATFEVRVGCEDPEAVDTRTKVEFQLGEEPPGTQISLSHTSLAWRSEVGDCSSEGTPFAGTVTASVAVNWEAPGFQEQTVPLEATVTKRGDPPMNEPRTYGPYDSTLTFTPGYYHEHGVDVHGTQEAGRDGVAVFNVTLESRSNAEARYTVGAEEVPSWVEATVEPTTLTLDPGESAPVQIRAEQVDQAQGNPQATLAFNTTGNTTHPAGGRGGYQAFGVIVDFSETERDTGQSGIPAVGLPWVTVVLVVIAACRRRLGRRSSHKRPGHRGKI